MQQVKVYNCSLVSPLIVPELSLSLLLASRLKQPGSHFNLTACPLRQEDKLKTYQSQSQQKEAFYFAQKRDIMILQEQLMCLQQKPRLYLLIYPKNSNKNAFNYENFCKYSKKNKDITVLPNDKITSR